MHKDDVEQDGPGIKPNKRKSHEIEPWYKRYARDFHDGTRKLSLEERGAYSDIIDLIFMNDGAIEDDQSEIAWQLRIHVNKWKVIRRKLLASGKLFVTCGKLHNARAQEVLIERGKLRTRLGHRPDPSQTQGKPPHRPPPGLRKKSSDFNGPLRHGSLIQNQEKEEEKKIRRFIPKDILTALTQQVGPEECERLVESYHTSGFAAGANNIRTAFPGWLRKGGIFLNLKNEGKTLRTRFSVAELSEQALGELCGRDTYGRPDTALPKTVSKKRLPE